MSLVFRFVWRMSFSVCSLRRRNRGPSIRGRSSKIGEIVGRVKGRKFHLDGLCLLGIEDRVTYGLKFTYDESFRTRKVGLSLKSSLSGPKDYF